VFFWSFAASAVVAAAVMDAIGVEGEERRSDTSKDGIQR
jgi:hypothetical protein